MAQPNQTSHTISLGTGVIAGHQHNQFQGHANQYAPLHHHAQVQAHHPLTQQQVSSPPIQSMSPYQAIYASPPANGYANLQHNQHHHHQHHQLQHPPPSQPLQTMAHDDHHHYGDVEQAMARIPQPLPHQSKLAHQQQQQQLTTPQTQHVNQLHHNHPQHHHPIQHQQAYVAVPAHVSPHQLDQVVGNQHHQHYCDARYMGQQQHQHQQSTHLSSPPGVAIGLVDQPSHEPIYPIQQLQPQHPNQHLAAAAAYYQPEDHHHHTSQSRHPQHHQLQQQHHHYQQYQSSPQQLFRPSAMLTPPRVEPLASRPPQMATPPRLGSANNLIGPKSLTCSPLSDNLERSSKKAESPLNQLHLQCANLLDEHQQQQQRISNILLKDGIDLSANNDYNITTTATTTTTPTTTAAAAATLAPPAATSAKTTMSTTSASDGDNNVNNDNNISTTATTGHSASGGNNNNNGNSNNNGGRSKRLRTSFKHNQLKEMKRYFATNQNPDANNLKTLAQTTGLSKRVLQVWFQNARAKHRRNTARLANQQLFNVVNQHTMLPRHHHQPAQLQTYQHHDTQHHQPIN